MLEIKSMTINDVSGVAQVEAASFSSPWPKSLFSDEITNPLAHYLIIEEDGKIIGYGGFWLILDEAQITNIAILPERRGQGLGKLLVGKIIQKAASLSTENLFLEVRKSNIAAQNLYKSFGFEMIGERKGYYQDNGEDAFLMRKEIITDYE